MVSDDDMDARGAMDVWNNCLALPVRAPLSYVKHEQIGVVLLRAL